MAASERFLLSLKASVSFHSSQHEVCIADNVSGLTAQGIQKISSIQTECGKSTFAVYKRETGLGN